MLRLNRSLFIVGDEDSFSFSVFWVSTSSVLYLVYAVKEYLEEISPNKRRFMLILKIIITFVSPYPSIDSKK